jgi:hypothetical protein
MTTWDPYVVESDPSANGGGPSLGEGYDGPLALELAEFISARSELPPALIGEEEDVLLPASGFLILGGKGGKGKTTLMIDAAFHLASGVDWLGFNVSRPLRILIFENEGPREMFRRKIERKRQSWPHEVRGAIFVHTLDWGEFDLADQGKRELLKAFVDANSIDIAFADPLDSFGFEGVGSPEDTRRFMALAKDAGMHRDSGTAWWFLHHPRKEKADDELDDLSGAWGGRPDTVLMLSVLAGERSRLAIPKMRWGRGGKRPALILKFDPDTEGFERLAEEGEERDYANEIAELLVDGKWRTAKETKDAIEASHAKVKEALENDERFVSLPGNEVGRSKNATVWGLAE